MEQLIEFILNHWLLSLLALVLLVMLAASVARDRLLGFREVKPAEAVHLINHEDAVVLDTRGQDEFAGGHILNAINIPLAELDDRIGDLDPGGGRPVIVCCRTGQRSARASAVLKKQGIGTIYKLAGGLTAWESAGLPLTKE